MTLAFPVMVPDWLISTHGIDLGARYGSACAITVLDVGFSAAGYAYVMYDFWRPGSAKLDETDPALRSLDCQLIARYDCRGQILGILMCGVAGPDGAPSGIPHGSRRSLCALPDGNIAVTVGFGSTYVISPELDSIVAEYPVVGDVLRPGLTRQSGFAIWMRVTPSGRLLCAVGEDYRDEHGFLGFAVNLVAIGDAAPLAVTRPILQVIATVSGLSRREEMDSDAHRPHVTYQGAPLSKRNRPNEALQEQLRQHFERTKEHTDAVWRGPYMMSAPEPLADDLFVLPLFNELYRGGNKGNAFAFCLIDEAGRLAGTLGGMDLWADSPYAGGHLGVATDPPNGRVYHLNENGLYAWSGGDWALQAKVSTTERPYSQLKQFELWGCSPDGEIVLSHRKQHVVLRIPAPEHLDDLNQVVAEALASYAKERAALKEALAPVDWFWTHAAQPGELHWL